ncbi:MAG: HAMP domain-containing histidine kinase [Chloroflexi bacterium]|nr:HAMP domain-containing histidine kinase [Chloroflexota bacterium]
MISTWLTRLINVDVSDPDDARRRTLLNILVLATLGCLVVGLGVTLAAQWMYPDEPGTWDTMYYAIGIAAVLCVISLALAHVNRLWAGLLAATLYLLLLLALAPGTDTPVEVVAGRSMVWLVIPVLAASFVLRPWASFVFFGASCAVVAGVAMSEAIPIVPNMYGFLVFFAVALVSWLAARGLERSIAEVRYQSDLRAAAERARLEMLQTQTVVLETRVAERTQELIDQGQRQMRFLDAVSHDLRSPLQAIMISLGTLQIELVDQELVDLVQNALVAAERLTSLADSLLDLAKLGQGEIKVMLTDVPLLAVVDNGLTIVRPVAQEKNIVLTVTGDDVMLRADVNQVKQIPTSNGFCGHCR